MKNDNIRNKIDTCPVCFAMENMFVEGDQLRVWNDEMEIEYHCTICGYNWIEVWKFICNIEEE